MYVYVHKFMFKDLRFTALEFLTLPQGSPLQALPENCLNRHFGYWLMYSLLYYLQMFNMCVCVYVCVCVCTYTYMYMYVCMLSGSLFIYYIYVCVCSDRVLCYVCAYVCTLYMYVCFEYDCVCVCVCVCVYVCVCMFVCDWLSSRCQLWQMSWLENCSFSTWTRSLSLTFRPCSCSSRYM